MTVSNRFSMLSTFENPVELWETFKRNTFAATGEDIGRHPSLRRGFGSGQTLANIEESHAARLTVNRDQYRALSRRSSALLRRDKDTCQESLEDVEGHVYDNDLRPPYRAVKKLCFMHAPQASTLHKAYGRLVLNMNGQSAQ